MFYDRSQILTRVCIVRYRSIVAIRAELGEYVCPKAFQETETGLEYIRTQLTVVSSADKCESDVSAYLKICRLVDLLGTPRSVRDCFCLDCNCANRNLCALEMLLQSTWPINAAYFRVIAEKRELHFVLRQSTVEGSTDLVLVTVLWRIRSRDLLFSNSVSQLTHRDETLFNKCVE